MAFDIDLVKRAALVIFFCLVAVFSVAVKTELRREKSPVAAIKIGQPMADFKLNDTSGNQVTFSEMSRNKKIVMVNFWATWCGPCRVEMPGLEKLYKDQKDNGFLIVAISEDKERARLDEYLKTKPVSFPVLVDSENGLASQLNIQSLPTTILIEQGGKVRSVHEGVQPYFEYVVREALSEKHR